MPDQVGKGSVACPRKGETCVESARGLRVNTSTVFRCVREALQLLAALAPSLGDAIEVAWGRAFVILRKIRSSSNTASARVAAVQTLMIASA